MQNKPFEFPENPRESSDIDIDQYVQLERERLEGMILSMLEYYADNNVKVACNRPRYQRDETNNLLLDNHGDPILWKYASTDGLDPAQMQLQDRTFFASKEELALYHRDSPDDDPPVDLLGQTKGRGKKKKRKRRAADGDDGGDGGFIAPEGEEALEPTAPQHEPSAKRRNTTGSSSGNALSFINTEADEDGSMGEDDSEDDDDNNDYEKQYHADENDGRDETSVFTHPDLQWVSLAQGYIMAKTPGSANDYYVSEEGISVREDLKIKCLMINHEYQATEIGRLSKRITICDMYLNIDDHESANDMALSIIEMLSGPHVLNSNNDTADVVTGPGAVATGEVDFSQLQTMMIYSEKRKKRLLNFLETDKTVQQFDRRKISHEKNAIERIQYYYVADRNTCRCGCGNVAKIKCSSCRDKFSRLCLATHHHHRRNFVFCPVCILCPPSMLDLIEEKQSEEEESEQEETEQENYSILS